MPLLAATLAAVAAPNNVTYIHNYVGSDGLSHMQRCAFSGWKSMPVEPGIPPAWLDQLNVTMSTLKMGVFPVGWFASWHRDPVPQYKPAELNFHQSPSAEALCSTHVLADWWLLCRGTGRGVPSPMTRTRLVPAICISERISSLREGMFHAKWAKHPWCWHCCSLATRHPRATDRAGWAARRTRPVSPALWAVYRAVR
jgi:hypothetical protein